MWDDDGRVCTTCNEYKLWDEFSHKRPKARSHLTGIMGVRQPLCKPCATAKTREWRESKSKDELKGMYLKRVYDITLSGFYALLIEQDGRCPLCEQILDISCGKGPIKPNTACVDHCHTQGHVRGILCNECNRGLGYFKDSPEALRRAAEYLEENDEGEN